jgi:hypothetical protein
MPTGWWSAKKANDDASKAKVSVYTLSVEAIKAHFTCELFSLACGS